MNRLADVSASEPEEREMNKTSHGGGNTPTP
jgi:hypothetical protein